MQRRRQVISLAINDAAALMTALSHHCHGSPSSGLPCAIQYGAM
ncbi:MAG: hypothetical protein ACI30W_00495 [Muribaculaceae bacterium]